MGKLLIAVGALLIIVGVMVVLAGRANIPLGRLPGDIHYRGKNTTVFFPFTTCVILSILLSFIVWMVNRFLR